MGKIVAIGGRTDQFKFSDIDKEIIRLSGKKNPKILFIPTGRDDKPEDIEKTKESYSKINHLNIDFLLLTRDKLTYDQIESAILGTDIIYVGGGNTLKMIELWKSLGVDKALKKAYDKEIVLSGVSAGAICWFTHGNSDSLLFSKSKSKKLIKIAGLGFIPTTLCPHFDVESHRQPAFKEMISKKGEFGIALENEVYMEYIDGKVKFLSNNKSSKAHLIYNNGKSVQMDIEKDKLFKNLDEMVKLTLGKYN